MVAVFTGSGLGLFQTSQSQLGFGIGGQSALGQSRESRFVNLATGNLVLQGQDEQLFGQGFGTDLTRTYNSLGQVGGQIGRDGWLTGFERRVDLTQRKLGAVGSEMTLWTGDGDTVVFRYAGRVGGQHQYESTDGDGAHDVLRWNDRDRTWTLIEGSTRREQVFADHARKAGLDGRLEIIRDGRTGAEFDVRYDRDGRVAEVRSANGDALVFGYDRAGQLESVSTREGGRLLGQVSYRYDGTGRLSRVTTDLTPEDSSDAAVFWTQYTYVDDTRMRIATVEQSDGVVAGYTYYDDGRLRTATLGDTNTDDSDGAGQTQTFVYGDGTTDVIDSAGRTWGYEFDNRGQLTRVLSPAVDGQRLVGSYGYDTDGNLSWTRDADGRLTSMSYDARGNLLRQVDNAGDVVVRTFSATNQLLTQATYPAGVESAQVTRFVYDSADRLRYTINAAGEVTEHVHAPTASGETQLSHSRTYLGARHDLAGLQAGQPLSESQMDRWASSQDLAKTSRVDLAYDLRGQLSERRSWATVDGQGRGVMDRSAEITRFSFDAQGLLRQQIVVRGAQRSQGELTSWSYDGMGRLLGSTDALGNASVRVHDDAGQRLAVTLANGLVRTEVRDQAGQVVAVTESAAGTAQGRTTRFHYDAQGRLRASEDASGARSYRFYDDAGRLAGTVDATGAVLAFQYNGSGQVSRSIEYASLVDTTAWLVDGAVVPQSLQQVLPAASADDRTVLTSYDAAGRLATQIDGAGTTTSYHYDGASRLVRVEVRAAATGSDAPRITRYFHDEAGRQIAALDAEGYLSEWRYDPAGRQILSIRYATATPQAQRADGGLAELRPLASDADVHTRNFYNGRGQAVATVDAEGYLTEVVFDEAGNARAELRYANAVTVAAGDSPASLRSRAGLARETRTSFDALGQAVLQVDAEGTVTRFSYDAMGLLVKTEAAAGTTEVRENNARYDVFGNLVGELGGEASTRLIGGMSEAELDALYAQYGVRHSYDALGRRTESVDADGNRTWYFYDRAGQLTQTVRGVADESGVRNASGEVVETRYNAFGQASETIAYTGRIVIAPPFERAQVAESIRVLQYVTGQDSRTVVTYDRRGLVAARADAEGFLTRFAYNAFGELSRETRAIDAQNDVVHTHRYDRLGRLQSSTQDANGIARQLGQSWDAFGRLTALTDGRGVVTSFEYDRLGRQIVQQQQVSGRIERSQTRYDAWSRISSQTDALGNTTSYAYDDATRSVVITTPEQVVLRTERNRHGETIGVRDGLGLETRFEYDHDGQLLRTVEADGAVSTRSYDARGLLTRSTDATGRTVDYRFDAAGRTLARIVDPEGLALTTGFAYDGQGRQITTTDPLGVVTRTEYDSNGRLVASIQDAGGLALRTAFSWDGLGRQLSVTEGAGSADARTVVYAYDGLGRRTSETVDPAGLGLVTSFSYDGNDNLVRQVDGAGNVTRFVYDEANRPTMSVDGAGGVTRTSYDAAGRLVATRSYARAIDTSGLPDVLSAAQIQSRLTADDARDVQGYRVWDGDGRVRYTVDGAGAVVRMDYDDANRLTQTRRHATAVTLDSGLRAQLVAGTLSADALAARVATDPAHDIVSSQVYDAAGRLRFSIDALGAVNESRFDASGRMVETRGYANPVAVAPALLAQLQAGQVSESEVAALVAGLGDAGRAQSFVYDAAGRQIFNITRATVGTADGVGVVKAFRYNAADRVTAEISYGVALPAYAVFADEAGLNTALQAAGAGDVQQQRATHFRFDAAGRLRFTIDSSGAVAEQRFDAVGRLSQSRSYGVTLGVVPASEAAVAAALSGVTDVRVTGFDYDDAGRLTRTTDALGNSEHFGYDGAGQRTAYTNRDGHRRTYDYDGAGRQIAERSPPVAVARFDANAVVVVDTRAVVVRTDYDGLGNVIARTEDAGQASARTTQYAYDNRGNQIRTIFPDAGHWDLAQNRLVFNGQQPTIEVVYDVLDRAVVHKDVRGFHQYRVHDAAGQLRYEVDQEGYVTAYRYNAFGEQTSLTRHSRAIETTAGQPMAIGDVESRLQAQPQSDRTLSTQYDLRGQKQQVQHDTVDYYDSAGTLRQQRPTTRFGYDVHGQLTRESVLLEGDPDTATAQWAHTTRYFDSVGRQTLTVDAEGYATATSYSAQGEVTAQIEYARAIAGGIDPSMRPAIPTPGDSASGFDRNVRFEYDALGRRIGETSLHHAHSSTGVASVREVVTAIDYDNEGHAVTTTVDGVGTATAYDALGRVVSVLESERDALRDDAVAQLEGNAAIRLDAAGLYQRTSPYTTTSYDAFGNAVEVRRYAQGWTAGQSAPRASDGDQVHTSRYDAQGRSVWDRDAVGTIHTRRFDAADNIVQARYRLDGSEGRWAEVVTSAGYDGLGRQVTSAVAREQYIGDTRLQRNGVAVSSPDAQSTVRYNAFGEIVAKDDRIADAFADARSFAQYEYDSAGRLLASNAEGGSWRSFGYNLAGHQVRESHKVRVESATGAVGSIDAVTSSRTDRLGRIVLRVMPLHSDEPGASAPTLSQRFDRWGNVLEATDPLGGQTNFEYNERDQAVRQLRAEVAVLHADGTETLERPETSWFYDALGRLVGTRDANGNIRRTAYDDSGRVIRNEDAFRSVTRFAYDSLGQQALTQDPLGYVSFRSFDRAGQVIAQGDFLTNIEGTQRTREVRESYQLDQNGGRIAVTDALGNTARYDHDSRGLILRSRTAAGVVMSFGYDSQGRKVRETNALSDPSLISEAQPVYHGGVIVSHVGIAGQPFAYVVPDGAFSIPSGERPTLSVQVKVWDPGQRVFVASSAFGFDPDTGTVSGTTGEGSYQITLVASSSSGQSASAAMVVRMVSQTVFAADHAGDPLAAKGLFKQSATAGGHFSYTVPADAFTDPQNQPLTYTAQVWGFKTYFERETSTTISRPAWIPLELSATDEHWLAFDPASRTLSGVARGGTEQVRITATDTDGNTASQFLSIATTPIGGRRTVTDDEGQTLFLDEQTWEYDHFGRIIDHNDLSGADYDYAYDPESGQLLEQSSDWTEAARSFSTPLDDYLSEFERPWLRPEEDFESRFDLGLPDPQLINDPKRSLSYYANGQLKEIREGANWTRYAYDASGNRTLEETLSHDADGQVIHLRTQTTYDSHNRISKVTQDELRASDGSDRRLLELRYAYDAMGNRRRVLARNAFNVNAPVIGTQNQPPVVASAIPAQHVLLGQTWTFQVPAGTFRDPEGGILQMAATLADGSPLPDWLQFDRPTQTFHGTPPGDTQLTLRLTATDLDGLSVSTQFALTASANQPPVVSGTIPPQAATEGVAWSYQVPAGTFTDPEGFGLTYSATLTDGSALPSWLQIGAGGLFSGIPALSGVLSVRVIATDSGGARVTLDFSLTVEPAPVTNPDAHNLGFELGDVGWDKGTGWTISSGDTFAGDWSAKFTPVGTASITHSALFPLEAGASYTASMKVSSRNDSAAQVILSWYDADGQSLDFVRGNLVKSGAWATSTVTGTPPAGAVYARVGGSAQNDSGEGPVVLDGFTFAKVTSDGGGGGGGGGGDLPPTEVFSVGGTLQTQVLEPEIDPEFPNFTLDPNARFNAAEPFKSYWYTYDAENRVTVANGQLVDGEIVLGNIGVSHALDYDAAGNATRRRFLEGTTQQVETTAYDQRGQRIAVFQAHALGGTDPAAWQQTWQYDDAGRIAQRLEYFASDAVHSNGVAIGGWLKHAEIYSFDADGRMLKQQIRGRVLGWSAPLPPPPPPPIPTSGPGAPELTLTGSPTHLFQGGAFESFTIRADAFIDHEDDPIIYTMTEAPEWLQYERLTDGRHHFFGTPPVSQHASVETREVHLTATDQPHGNWTRLEFSIVERQEGDGSTELQSVKDEPVLAASTVTATTTDNPQATNLGVLSQLSTIDYSNFGYDAAGRSRGYQFLHHQHEDGSGAKADDPKGFFHNYAFQYEGRDSYLERQVFGSSSQSNFRATSSVSDYDAWGRRTAVREQTPLPSNLGTLEDRVRYFSYDGEGHILRRREGTLSETGAFVQTTEQALQTQLYTYTGGQQVASGKRNGEIDVIGRLTAYDSSEIGTTRITVQAGDTLRGIAQRVYGNANLWYVLAEANAITDAQLTAGTSLTVPEVKVTANDANTFKPYNPSEAIGNTAPSLPYIAPPPPQQCNALAMILVIIVVIVVTVFTAGAAASAAGATGAVTATGATATGIGAIGGAVVSGGTLVGTISAAGIAGSAFIGGVAGSIAGQVVGKALGVRDSFSLREAFASGLTAAAGAGIASGLNAGSATNAFAIIGDPAKAAASAVLTGLSSHAANRIAGIDSTFSWRAIAASAVTSAITSAATPKVAAKFGEFGTDLTANLIGRSAGVHVRRAFGFDDQINYLNIAADAFGNALGNQLVRGLGSRQANGGAPGGNVAEEVGMGGVFEDGSTAVASGSFGPASNGDVRRTGDIDFSARNSRPDDDSDIHDYDPDGDGISDRVIARPDPESPGDFVFRPNLSSRRAVDSGPGPANVQFFSKPPQSVAPAVGGANAADSALLGIKALANSLRERSRSIVDNANSPGEAAFGAGVFAVNSVTSLLLDDAANFGRLFTNKEQQEQFVSGLHALVTTNPLVTAENAFNAFNDLPREEKLTNLAAGIIGASTLVSKVGKAAKVEAPPFFVDRRTELLELFDPSHARSGIQTGNRSLIPAPNIGNARVFSGASDAEVLQFFQELTGAVKMPPPRLIQGKGMIFTIKTPDGNFNLRDFSTSAGNATSVWTIDVPRGAAGTTFNPEIKFLRGG